MSPQATLSLTHLVREASEREPGGRPPLLLLLHGIGSNEMDLMGLAPQLDARFFVVSARAPLTLGRGAYGWYHTTFLPEGPVHDPAEAEESRALAARFVDELVTAYALDSDQVYLMGFSQGAIMSLSITLTQPEKIAGAVIMSGRLLPEIVPQIAADELKGMPIFVSHGIGDTVLPIAMGREIKSVLDTLPVALTYREYPMRHEITPQCLADIEAWLAERLDTE